MKAKMRIEVNCGECGGQMQYHENSKFVKCNGLKCKERGVLYNAPTITLTPVKKPEKEKTVKVEK